MRFISTSTMANEVAKHKHNGKRLSTRTMANEVDKHKNNGK